LWNKEIVSHKTKLLSTDNRLYDVDIVVKEKRMFFYFPFNRGLIDTIKYSFEGRKWHGPPVNPNGPKVWSAPITQRNIFTLEYLKNKYGCRPFAKFDKDFNDPVLLDKIKEYCLKRLPSDKQPMAHQIEMIAQAVSTKSFIWAAEMGTGKTLAAFMTMELLALWEGIDEWFWAGINSSLRSTELEIVKWNLRIVPSRGTYERIKRMVGNWQPGKKAPAGVIGDEGSKLKTPTSQRSEAFKHLADSMRQDHGENSCIGLLSGTPAPKSPLDWWHLCEVVCPGFLSEKDLFTFKDKLAIIENRDKPDGGSYPHLVSWRDDSNKCNICGLFESDDVHDMTKKKYKHSFVKSVNEVSRLHNRMKGLVLVKLKKDCVDLPDKIYEIKRVSPTPEIVNIAKMIIASSRSTIDALTKLRMLSDGFQYVDEQIGVQTCELCLGSKKHWEYIADVNDNLTKVDCVCPHCGGEGEVPKYRRETQWMDCPKETLLEEDLELHEEVGRLNVYGGFTATIDRIVKFCHSKGWTTIRADGRGWEGRTPLGEVLENKTLLQIYDQGQELYPKMVFVGQPGAAGMGITLTASPTTVFYSNDFNGESRMQTEDRGHRIGMDKEKGGRITDYVHLDTDLYILENLKKKRNLQHMSMTGLKHASLN